MAPSTGAMSPELCTVIAGTMGWLAPPPHHVREWSWDPRSMATVRHCPSGWGNCPPILHPAGRVQCLRGRVLPGPKMRPATSLTVFVATIANPASPALASAVSAMPAVMAWTVSRQVFRVTSYQTWRPTPMARTRMKMPMPRATSHCVTLQGLRSFSEG